MDTLAQIPLQMLRSFTLRCFAGQSSAATNKHFGNTTPWSTKFRFFAFKRWPCSSFASGFDPASTEQCRQDSRSTTFRLPMATSELRSGKWPKSDCHLRSSYNPNEFVFYGVDQSTDTISRNPGWITFHHTFYESSTKSKKVLALEKNHKSGRPHNI